CCAARRRRARHSALPPAGGFIMKRTTNWRTAALHSEAELGWKELRLDRINRGVARAIAAMQRGATLHRINRPNSTSRQLSNGSPVSGEVARAVIARGDVVGTGDSLFNRDLSLSQTWRFVEP